MGTFRKLLLAASILSSSVAFFPTPSRAADAGILSYLPAISAGAKADRYKGNAIALPRTGQKTCYDSDGSVIDCAGTGQDGECQAGTAWPDPRFKDNGDGTVTDTLTGLMWLREILSDQGSPAKNYQYISDMNHGNVENFGHDSWRMPNFIELKSLFDYNQNYPDFPGSNPFSKIPVDERCLQSSTSYSYYSPDDFYSELCFHTGYMSVSSFYFSIAKWFWPVRDDKSVTGKIKLPKTGQKTLYHAGDDGNYQKGVGWPKDRFRDNGDGTVTDDFTGLMWTKNADLFAGNWQDSLDYVKAMDSGEYENYGYTDWKMPNMAELGSIIDAGNAKPALPKNHPFIIDNYCIWTSTNTPKTAYSYCLADGSSGAVNKISDYGPSLWPVRDVFRMKIPLPGGKHWKLNTECGGKTACGIPGPDPFHEGSGYFSLDFDDTTKEDGHVVDVPILAAAAGVVESVSSGGDYGNTILVDHRNGFKTRYAHLREKPSVSGEVVQGQRLGIMDTTGNSTGIHLHFQVYYNGTSSSETKPLHAIIMDGLRLEEYTVGCPATYLSTNAERD